MNEVQPFYRFRAEAGEEPNSAELLIFSVIGDWEELGERSAIGFAKDLANLPSSVKRLDIHINSPGGSVSEAMGIYSRLADHRSDKHVYIDGLAASAASLVAMVGHKIYIRANANMMIHLPMAIGIGNSDDFRGIIAALDSHTESMLNVYARRTKMPREDIRALMSAETWFHPDEAVSNGFADEVRGVIKAAATVGPKRAIFNGVEFDLSRFHNVPAFTGEQQRPNNMKTKPKAESAPAPEPTAPEQPETPPAEPPTPPAQPPADPTPPPVAAPPAAAPANEYERGVQAERARIAALQKHDKPATHAIITKAIAEGKSFTDVAEELFAALENAGTQKARRADASSLTSVPASEGGDADGKTSDFGTRIKNSVKAKMKSRAPALFSRN